MNAISAVRRVAALLKLLGLPAVALHASMQQRQRLKALDKFKADPTGVLVATDVAARGLDITVSTVTKVMRGTRKLSGCLNAWQHSNTDFKLNPVVNGISHEPCLITTQLYS